MYLLAYILPRFFFLIAVSYQVELRSEPLPLQSLNGEYYFRSSEAMCLNSFGLSGVAMCVSL